MAKGTRFYLFSFSFFIALWFTHQQSQITGRATVGLIALGVVLICVLCYVRRLVSSPWPGIVMMIVAGALSSYALGSMQILWRLAEQLPAAEENRIFRLQIEVQSLPEVRARSVQFVARVLAARPDQVPGTLLVRWYAPDWGGPYRQPVPYEFPAISPGEKWQITAVLRSPHGTYNRNSFDYEQYAFAQGWRALATVRGEPQRLTADDLWLSEDNTGWPLDSWLGRAGPGHWFLQAEIWRGKLKTAMAPFLEQQPWGKVIQALTLGDRSSFSDEDWQLFNRAGLTHLISISGTHISLVAGSLGLLVTHLFKRTPLGTRWLLRWRPAAFWGGITAVGIAALYSAIAGWGVPTRRSFFMLFLVVLNYLTGISLSRWQLLAGVALVVLVFDPWAMLSSGFWLSFGAVAVLLACFQWSGQKGGQIVRTAWQQRRTTLYQFGVWQLIITLLLWPILVWYFSEFSLVSVISNLYAITLLGTFATPLSLLFALCAWALGAHPLTELFLHLALWAVELTMWPTEWLVQSQWAALTAARPPAWVVMASLVGLVIALCPRFWRGQKWFWLAVLPALFWPAKKMPEGAWSIEVLDVGQGLAVVIQTQHHHFVYDTGKRSSPVSDDGVRIIGPYLRTRGVQQLDGVIISHADLDHVGGLRSLMRQFPIRNYFANFPLVSWWQTESARLQEPTLVPERAALQGALPISLYYCQQGLGWEVDGVRFRFLWPKEPLTRPSSGTAERNAASCVLEIQGRYHQALLLGDIALEQEQQLLSSLGTEPYAVIVVAHHGSRHGSSQALIQQVRACVAVAGTGWWNRFNHPHPEVVTRWQKQGTQFMATHQWGSVLLESHTAQLQWQAQRWHQRRYWHNPLGITTATTGHRAKSNLIEGC